MTFSVVAEDRRAYCIAESAPSIMTWPTPVRIPAVALRMFIGGFWSRWICLVCWLGFTASVAAAQAPLLDPLAVASVNAAVRRTLAEDRTPSASIAIVLNGKLAYAAAYGYSNLAQRVPATIHTRYQLASISKTLTATVLLLLEQDGKLSLDSPISRWLPDVTDASRVTVRELLAHTSGFPDHYPQTYPAGPRARPTTPNAIIAEWGHHPLLFAPGSRFRYSNLNYVMAGWIAEKIAHEPLFAIMKSRIFGPLDMRATINLDTMGANTPDVATGYMRPALAALQPAPEEGRGWSFGSGQVVTTATDLAQWDQAFLAGKLLAPRQAKEEVTPPRLADGTVSKYAIGLFLSRKGGRTVYYNVGQGLGFLAINRIYPAQQASIIVLTNTSSSLAFAHIADRLEYLVIPPTPEDAQARELFRSVQGGMPDRSRFSQDLNTYFDDSRARLYHESLGPLGPPESFVLHASDEADGITTLFYEVVAGGRRLRIIEQLLANGKVESFQVEDATR